MGYVGNTFKATLLNKGIKVTVKTFIMLQNISVTDQCCSFELSIHQSILKKVAWLPQD